MRTPRVAHGMVRRMRRPRVCEACDRGAEIREIRAAHANRAEKVATSCTSSFIVCIRLKGALRSEGWSPAVRGDG